MAKKTKKEKKAKEVANVEEKEVNVASEENQEIDELTKTKNEAAEANDKFLRLYSEFDNFRKRTAREKLDILSTASGELMKKMLPIFDDFERAIQSNEEVTDVEALKDGFKLIHQKMKTTLQQAGLKEMEMDEENTFNPDLHEAITQIPAPSEKLKGKVVDVVEKGYFINEKVIRFAKVVVGS